jgi:DNA repair protein RAD5
MSVSRHGTTDGSLQSEIQWYLKKKKNDEDAPMPSLLGHSWKRLILDEAHCIKNNATYAAKACGMIESERRWCVSGTIIQNSIDDVFSLLKFLRHEPWCEHSFWKAAIGRVDDLGTQLDRVKRLLAPIMIRRTKETLGADG